MIVPSIDLMDGQAVQLVQGKTRVLDAGDPRPLARRFGMLGEVAVIDLDAALGRGSNAEVIKELLRIAPCRVGGGVRSAEAARAWLDAGARKVILGTAARREVLRELPRERVIAALDARDGEVVVDGWRTGTGARVPERMRELRDLVGGFLVTFVEVEGTLSGLASDRAGPLIDAAGSCRLTLAGGVRDAGEVGALDRLGVDAQVGMAVYTGAMHVADAIGAVLMSDRSDGLWPTVVVDEAGEALGLAYSNPQSLRAALDEQRGVYWSRSRGLWRKGEASGCVQELMRVDADCDRDTLRFTVRQSGGVFCHTGSRSCWGQSRGIAELARRLIRPPDERDEGSYTSRLLREPGLLGAKIREEARELAEAGTREQVINEAADVVYFTLAKLASAGIALDEVARELDQRALKVSRRPGNAKPGDLGGER